MTPREMSAAIQGHARSERVRFITVARAFGSDLSAEAAERIIEGKPLSRSRSPEEQEQKLQEIRERNGWDSP
jgi:hypothetical protein